MTISKPAAPGLRLPAHHLIDAVRPHFGSRRGLLVLAAVALVAGLALNWSWLVAAGVAPFLLSALPCVAMCALGLCMSKGSARSCAAQDSAAPASKPDTETAQKAK